MSHPSAFRQFESAVPVWVRFFDQFQPPAVFTSAEALRALHWHVRHVRRRLQDGPLTPLRWALFGPTGAGKSKLFNSLIGRTISPAGVRRPFTRRACYYLHDTWKGLAASLAGQVELHHDPQWEQILLIDTPDFDSVELTHRDEAERVFYEADGYLFVTDALKYADASTWEYLERIHWTGKPFAVVLNKVSSPVIPQSFTTRFRTTLSSAASAEDPCPTIAIPEFPIRDETLIDATHPALRQLAQTLQRLVTDQPAQQSVERWRGELTQLFSRTRENLDQVTLRQAQIGSLHQRLQARQREAAERLERRLAEGLEPAVREEVYQRVLQRLDSIDVLRYPRKLLAMPLHGLQTLLSWWQGRDRQAGQLSANAAAADPLASETFHMLEAELIRFADESRLDIIQQDGWSQMLPRDAYRQLRLPHDEIQQRFSAHHNHYVAWVAEHARETASEITGENKFKFVLSQVLFHTVLITAQVKTGGGFTLLEAGFDGVVSPFVAKAVSMAIGSEKVKQFEAAAHREHQRSLAEVLAAAELRFADFLHQAGLGLDELQRTLQEILPYQSEQEALVREFAAGLPGASSTPAPPHSPSDRGEEQPAGD